MSEKRTRELLGKLVNDMVEKAECHIHDVAQNLLALGFTRQELLALSFQETDISGENPQNPYVECRCCDNPSYKQQQEALAEIAAKLGVVASRMGYQGKLDAKNTVLFYLREDYEYNKEAERWSEPRSVPVLTESGKLETVQGYVQCKPFWSFENSDSTGRVSCDFANQGQIDLRDSRWKETLEGHIRFALAKERQLRHIGRSGGWDALRESDEVYNDLNRELIAALKLIHGTAYLGSVNFYDEDHRLVAMGQKSVYEEYTGQLVYNFGCSFCVPTADEKLEELIRAWNGNDKLPKSLTGVDAIVNRVVEIGGINLLWY